MDHNDPNASGEEPSVLSDVEQATTAAASSPRTALQSPQIAELFTSFVTLIAPWYDLNDSEAYFGTLVPSLALDSPVLFKAVIALAACHKYKTLTHASIRTSNFVAPAFHAACVRELLLCTENLKPEMHGHALAATCLLRSYEILNSTVTLLFLSTRNLTEYEPRRHQERTTTPSRCLFLCRQ